MKLTNILFEQSSVSDSGWIENIKTMNSIKEIRTFMVNHFGQPTTAGLTREVWLMDKFVFKLVIQEKYVKTNQNEIKIHKCLDSDFFAKILDFDKENFFWLTMEKIDTSFDSKAKVLRNLFDFDGNDEELLFWFGDRTFDKNTLMASAKDKNAKDWIKRFFSAMSMCSVEIHDLHDENFGVRNGSIVFFDYGELALLEQNTLASGNVVGYMAPLGAKGIGSDNALEKGFWRKDAGKQIKTASPALHKKNKKVSLEEMLYSLPEDGMNEIIDEPKRQNPKTLTDLGIGKESGKANIISVFNEATPEEKEYWGKWYHHANEMVKEMAVKFNLPTPVVAAVVATVSPGNRWKSNILAANNILTAFSNGQTEGIRVNAYPRQVKLALKILQTGNIGLVSGPKVSVFFQSLLDPKVVENNLVLDSHAINIWRGEKKILKQTSTPTKLEREQMISDYQEAAKELNVPVQALQAITWYVWKYTTNPPTVPSMNFNTKKGIKMGMVENFGAMEDVDTKPAKLVKLLWPDYSKKVKTDSEELHEEKLDNESLMKKMGYEPIGKNYRLGSDTYLQKDDKDKDMTKKYVDMANANIEKSNPKTGNSLKDPAGVGVSLPKKVRG